MQVEAHEVLRSALRSALLGVVTVISACSVDDVRFSAGNGNGSPDGGVDAVADAPMAQMMEISVEIAGSGAGRVTGNGLDCPGLCRVSILQGTVLTLTGVPAGTSSFSSWSGAGCSGTGPCTFTATGDVTIGASFTQHPLLDVAKRGFGSGTVTSAPPGINCGGACNAPYAPGTPVVLSAASSSDSLFTGWSGACAGTGSCTVSMSEARSVIATFVQRNPMLFVMENGGGDGVILTSPSQYNCSPQCTVPRGTLLTLTAFAHSSSRFSRWSLDSCPGTGPCSFTVNDEMTIGAYFELIVHTLTVTKTGLGSGTVTSGPNGIDCGTRCSAPFMQSYDVFLNATPDPGSVFTGWSGACTGTGACALTMPSSLTVNANFARIAP